MRTPASIPRSWSPRPSTTRSGCARSIALSRDLWWLVAVVATLVLGLVLYAWPHLQVRQVEQRARTDVPRARAVVEVKRKLRLEKASLENLKRVEQIALRDLGLRTRPRRA